MNLPYIHIYKSRGKQFAYYRRGGLCQRIHGEIGSPEFLRNYQRIHESFEAAKPDRPGEGTLSWLVERYLVSPEFTNLAERTRADYRRVLDFLRSKYGRHPWAILTRRNVLDLRDKHASTPAKINRILTVLSLLGRLAVDLGLRPDNPAEKVRKLRSKGPGYRAWKPEELQQFEERAKHPKVRLAFLLGLYTGQRKGDILRMTWKDIKGNEIRVVQQKTAARLGIPLHPRLAEALSMVDRGALTILASRLGRPYTSDGFSTVWRREILACDLDGVTFHGLRRCATAAMAEAGCTDREIMAVTGHKTSAMVGLYTRDAQQRKLAGSAMRKRIRNEGVANNPEKSG